jgi:hypothetical protein
MIDKIYIYIKKENTIVYKHQKIINDEEFYMMCACSLNVHATF